MSFLLLLQTRGARQTLTGTLQCAGAVTVRVKTPVAVTGTLTMDGALTTVARLAKSLAGALTMSGSTSSTYVPPSPGGDDALTTRFRRNQTD